MPPVGRHDRRRSGRESLCRSGIHAIRRVLESKFADKGHRRRDIKIEKRHIQLALNKTGGNVSLAAQLLEVDRATVYNKVKKYCLSY